MCRAAEAVSKDKMVKYNIIDFIYLGCRQVDRLDKTTTFNIKNVPVVIRNPGSEHVVQHAASPGISRSKTLIRK